MVEPELPADERERLEALRAIKILGSAPEERFDRLTRMARRMFGVPISLVSLVDNDRQWFKSKQGLNAEETPRDISFCGHAILGDGAFIVSDALADDRFKDNPLVVGEPNIRFYAGFPLRVSDGSKLGTLCLIDRKPRDLNEEDRQLLRDLATMVEQEIAAVQLATLDELTMISNRRGFIALVEQTLQVGRRKNWPVSLLFFDLNKFKSINDRFGHAEGDRALVSFATAMKRVFRDSDVFARVGGDEFAALLVDSDKLDLEKALKRFGLEVDAINNAEHRGYNIEYSVGSVSYPAGSSVAVEDMMARADEQMYSQKRSFTETGS